MRLRGASRRVSDSASGSGDRRDACRTLFQPGAKVEVRTDDEGFRGAWHEAVVLRSFPTFRRYQVSYVSLLSDEDPSEPLREVVSRSNIRPPPPPAAGDEVYPFHARVEAFHNDGWWSGVVSGVLPAVGRYNVCIPTSREEIEFGHSELRPQLHWVGSRRRWIPAEEMNHGQPKFKVGDTVEVTRDRGNHGAAWFHATIVKAFDSSTFLVEYCDVKSESNSMLPMEEILDSQYMRPGLPAASLAKDFTLGDEVEVLLEHGWSAGTVLEAVDDEKYIVKLKRSEEKLKLGCDEMRHQRFWTGVHWVFRNKKVRKLLDSGGTKSPKRNKKAAKSSSFPIHQSASSDNGEVAQEHNADTPSIKWIKTYSLKRPRSEGKAVASKSANVTSSEYITRLELNDSVEFGRASVIPTGLEIEKRVLKEKHHSISPNPMPQERGPKHNSSNVNDISQLPLSDQELLVSNHDGSRHEAETLEVNDSLVHSEHNDFIPITKWTNSKCSWSSKVIIRKRRKRFIVQVPKRRKLILDIDSREQSQSQIIAETGGRPPDMFVSGTGEFVQCELENPENSPVVVESGDGRKNDDPNQGVHGDKPCEDSSFVIAMHEDSIENQRALLDPQPSAKKVPLPFVKNSLLWESIESMDIFRKIPQEPHFRCLEQHSTNFQEGMAIGLMVSFANLVSSIEKLSITEAPTSLEEKLKALEAFEANGFNVECVKMRLTELLQLQLNQTESERLKSMLEAKMVETKEDCNSINAIITSYDMAIGALESNIARIREKKDSMMKLKESSESNLVKFESEAHEAEEVCRTAEERFIAILATPWCAPRAL